MTLLKIGQFYADSKLGLIYDEKYLNDFKNLDNAGIRKLSLMRHQRRMSIMKDSNKILSDIKLWSNGLLQCNGDCDYCYRHLDNVSLNSLKHTEFLDPNYLDYVLKQINKFYSDDTHFVFFGSSFFDSPYVLNIFDVIKNNTKNYCNISLVNDMMNNDENFYKSLETISNIISDEKVKEIDTYITVDFGSASRHSNVNNIDNRKIIDRAKLMIDTFKDTKLRINIKSNFGKLTNTKQFVEDFYDFSKLQCALMFSPVSHDIYEPTIEMMKWFFDFVKQYEKRFLYRGELFLIKNDFDRKFLSIIKQDTNEIIKLNDDIYADNEIITCQAYTQLISVRNNTTSACCYDYLSEHTDDPEKSIVLDKNSNDFNILSTLPEHCIKCDMVGVCGQCIPRRHIWDCRKHPALLMWEKYVWETKCKEFLKRNDLI
jgi:hypothetical protein